MIGNESVGSLILIFVVTSENERIYVSGTADLIGEKSAARITPFGAK